MTAYLGEHEKVLLAFLSVVIVISGTFWFRQYSGTSGDQPAAGGTFVDGVVGSRQQIEDEAAHLTKAGLFTFDKDGDLENQLISAWTVDTAKTTYRFTLKSKVPINEIRDSLAEESDLLGNPAVTTDHNQLVITLQSPDPSLPLLLAEPLFDFGPYKISKLTSQSAILIRNTRAEAGNPYINRVIINAYPSENELIKALKNNKVDGARTETATQIGGFESHHFNLSLYYAVFFNLNRAPFRDQSFGQKVIAANVNPGQPFVLTAPSNEPYQSIAKDLVSKWQAAGAKVTLEMKTEAEIKNTIAPTRDFQALLSGLDYGYELDPYYLWDQSQIRPPGNNLSGVKSSAVQDAIAQIQQTTNIVTREGQIQALHQTLQSQGVALVVGQQTSNYLVSTALRTLTPWAADSPTDWLQSFALWSFK